MKLEYIIIGAGFAALSAARHLLDSGVSDFLVLEEGNATPRRVCPGSNAATCVSCRRCDVVSGIGGANALHGNKLCYFPASSGVAEDRSVTEIAEALATVNRLLDPLACYTSGDDCRTFDSRKFYFSDVLSLVHFQDLVNRLAKPIIQRSRLETGVRVKSVRKNSAGGFDVITDRAQLRSEKVLWATGRRAALQSTSIYSDLGVEFGHSQPDFGIRIQSRFQNFSSSYYYQADPKFKFSFGDGVTGRTFCAHNRGQIVPVLIDRGFYADGAFGKEFTDLNNIALMMRGFADYAAPSVDRWCAEINSKLMRKLRFRVITTTAPGIDGLCELNRALTEVGEILPSDLLRRHWPRFIRELIFGDASIFSAELEANSRFDLFAPAVDRYWPQPVIDRNFQTTCRGFFVAGDAAAKSRGFFQAMVSGCLWAQGQTNKFFQDSRCSTLVSPAFR